MRVDFELDANKVMRRLGINPGGKAQAILDSSVIKYLRNNMPRRNGMMEANTRRETPGLIIVDSPYAHYMNQGIKYVMPKNGKSAYYSPTYGFWSDKGKKKIPSGEPLQYHGGPNRGAHFVERTLNGNLEDIINDVKKGMKQ